jgi:chromosome segregation ATPase
MESLKKELEAMEKEFEAVKAARAQFVQRATELTTRLVQIQGSYQTLKKLIEEKGGTVDAPKQEVPAEDVEVNVEDPKNVDDPKN